MKKLLLFVLTAITFSFSQAQQADILRADRLYEQLAFTPAIKYYERALKKKSSDHCILRLADCYRLTNQYDKAGEYYQRAMAISDKPPITVFYYAHTLLMQQDFRAAKEKFISFFNLNPKDKRGKQFADEIDRIEEMMRDSSRYTIQLLPFNTDASDFGAIPYNGGIIFSSARAAGNTGGKEFQWVKAPYLDLFFTKNEAGKSDTSFVRPEALKGEINTRYHESNFTWMNGSKTIWFNRNNYIQNKKGTNEEGIILLKIFSAQETDGEFGSVKEFIYNNDQYNVCHPSLSADGEFLYFVSDKPGGQGGKDIYRCRKEGNGWGIPQNLGPSINTPGDEMFPYIHTDGILYFSSDGHPGLGHLDLFSVNLNRKDTLVSNMGGGLNSAYDDFSFFLNPNGSTGYFSSNRKGGKGDDDIYSFKMGGAVVEIIVMDKVAKLPIENARIEVDEVGGKPFVLLTDSAGRTTFPTELGRRFTSMVNTIEFDPHPLEMTTISTSGENYFKYLVELANPPPSLTAIVIDDATKERLPGAKVEMIYLPTKDTTTRFTDRNARFSIKLGKEATYKMVVTHPGYLTYSEIVSTTELTYDGDTIIPLKMERIRFNEPIVLKNIHYDFDKWFIRNDAKPDLDKLVTLMKDNPQLLVELSSHTDCRGSDEYNIVLSHKRALAAREYLILQGVNETHIIGKGYGETKMVNECDDDVPCDENRHFANRRTEFKIIGTINGIDIAHSVLVTSEDPNTPPIYVPEGGAQVPYFSQAKDPSQQSTFNNPILPDIQKSKGNASAVYFRVQLAAFNEQQSEEKLKELFEYSPFAFFIEEGGMYKYMVGEYKSYREALKAQMHLRGYGFSGAFVSAWIGTRKLTAAEMQQHIK